MIEFKKPTLTGRLNMAISVEMEAHLAQIAQEKDVSVSCVARELIADSLRRNFEKIEDLNGAGKKKRRYTKRQLQTDKSYED